MRNSGTLVKILVNSLIGLGLILVWLQFVDLNTIWSTIQTVAPVSLAPVVFFMILSPVIRAIRFKYFLKPIVKVGAVDMVFLSGASILLNFLIPVRAGEILKGVYLNGRYSLPIAKSLILVFLDRYLDFLVVLVVGALLLLVVPTTLSITLVKLIVVIFLLGILVTYLLTFRPEIARKIALILIPILYFRVLKVNAKKGFDFFLENFQIFKRSPKDLAILIAFTLAAYLADSLIWYFMFLGFGSVQPVLNMYLAQLLSALTYLIPAAPGYVGSTEASGILIFSGIFGIEKNLTASMIVLFHIVTVLMVLVVGIFSIYFLKIDINSIFKKVFKKEATK